MKICPFCAEQIQKEAIKCRYCGEFLDGRGKEQPLPLFGYEYRSKKELFGIPVVHIAKGIDMASGKPRIAKGVIAVGNIAVGLFALGGVAIGGLALGGFSMGLIALGGVAAGGISLGGLSIGAFLAVGGAAFSFAYAIGGFALAKHAIGGSGADPELLQMIRNWFP